ncbi:MAG: TonB-dependent receptor, partial [Burkholderiales bacterium]
TADGEIDPAVAPLVSLDTRVKTTAAAGFGEANVDISDRLHVIAGMRYSWEKQEGLGSPAAGILPPRAYPNGGKASASAWTPRVSVRYDISSEANVYATYSKGFKSVVVDSVQSSDATADPEHLTAYEIGAKIGTRNLSLNLAAFLYDYKDLQVLFFDGVTSTLTNAASAKIIGLEADANIRLHQGLSLKLAGSWLPRARYEQFPGGEAFALPNGPGGMQRVSIDASGQRLLRAPRFTGSTTLSYAGDVGTGRLDANATLYYSSSFDWDLLRRVQTKSYAQINATIGYRPSSLGVRFYIFGKNLTNKANISGALLTAGADGVSYSAPRLIGVGAEISF